MMEKDLESSAVLILCIIHLYVRSRCEIMLLKHTLYIRMYVAVSTMYVHM